MTKNKVLVIVSLAVVSLLLTGSLLSGRNWPVDVKTTRVTRGEISSYLSTSGKVRSQTTEQYFGIPQLTVLKVNVKEGDSVTKGQALVEFNTEDLYAGLKQAQVQYSNALLQKKEALGQQKQVNTSIAKLDAQIDALRRQYPADEAQIQALSQKREALQPVSSEKIQMLENSIRTAKQSLDSASKKYSDAKKGIVSEIDGVLTQLNANEGSALSMSAPAAVVEDLDRLKVSIALGKYDVVKVKTGQQVLINNAGQQHQGTITYISPTAESTASAAKVPQAVAEEMSLSADAEITDPGADLKIGFDVDTSILIARADSALKIPSEAVRNDKTAGNYVMLVRDNKAVRENITLGIQSDTEAQVLEGLAEGDTLILSPVEDIKNGTAVRVPEDKEVASR